MADVVDIVDILPLLPRRYPVPLVDRVLECVPRRSIRGLKNVTINEPYFQGHFPGYPVMPGVLVIEALIQLCSILAVESGALPRDGTMLLYFPKIPACRFKRQVIPGDCLLLECEMVAEGTIDRFSIRASVEGEIAAEGTVEGRLVPIAEAPK